MPIKRDADPLDELRAAREAAARLTSHERTLRQRFETLGREIRQVESAPPALEEVLAAVDQLVDQAAAGFRQEYEHGFLMALSGGRTDSGDRIPPQLPRVYSFAGQSAIGFPHFAALMPDATKALLRHWAQTSDMPWGLAPEARAARLEALRAEHAEVRAAHTALVDAANAEGLSLPLLEDVQQERDAAAREERRQQELERQRALLAHGGPEGLSPNPAPVIQHARMYPNG